MPPATAETIGPRLVRLYALAEDMAMLHPTLGNRQRADTLLAVAEGWADMGETERVLFTLTQTTNLLQYSPDLAPSARRPTARTSCRHLSENGDVAAARTALAIPAAAIAQTMPVVISPREDARRPIASDAGAGRFRICTSGAGPGLRGCRYSSGWSGPYAAP